MNIVLVGSLFACTSDELPAAQDTGVEELPGIGALGHESHDLGAIQLDVLGTSGDGLDVPRDLDFNPDRPGELWVVNRADDSSSIFFDAGTEEQTSQHYIDPLSFHFMEEVSSIAMGAPGTFGTCQESRNTYNDLQQANDFMGPTLWSTDFDIFAKTNPKAVEYLTKKFGHHVDLGSHLDMLHETPLCMGIVWQDENVYWVFDGLYGSIDRVDFHEDHGPGYDDHSDGIIVEYVRGELERVEDVPSHLVYDGVSRYLYIADTGNNRIAVLDTETGTQGWNLGTMEAGTEHYEMKDADLWTLIDGDEVGLEQPSGLAMHNEVLYVGDHATGTLWAFDLEGNVIDYLDLELDGLMGIEVVSEDEIWVVDAASDQLLRLTAPVEE